MDIAKFDKQHEQVYKEMCKTYKYSSTAKLAKGEFYKFLTTLGIPEKSQREMMNKLIKPDCMNAKSILGLSIFDVSKIDSKTVVPPPPKKKDPEPELEDEEEQSSGNALADDEEACEEQEENEEEEEVEEVVKTPVTRLRKKLHRGTRLKSIQNTSLVESFKLMKYTILRFDEMSEEDLREMTAGDLKAITLMMRVTYTSMYRVAQKYIPQSEFKRCHQL